MCCLKCRLAEHLAHRALTVSGPAISAACPPSAHPVASPAQDAQLLDKTSRRLTSDPIRISLGLLPSGPDPIGEWLVHRQSPGPYFGPKALESKRGGGAFRRETGPIHHDRACRDPPRPVFQPRAKKDVDAPHKAA